jgi:hypothetical protein
MPVQSCLYYLERPTDNRPISIIRTLQGHDPITRWPACSSSYQFFKTPFSVKPQKMDFATEPKPSPGTIVGRGRTVYRTLVQGGLVLG